ncbi:MAG: cobalamin-dependent protein [Gemmatimonadetes bacterium]|nr:cobalamin-dependent protein [Gemmatimonadota bacterium]
MTPQLYHPLRVVIQRTGLTADLLRAWERRYAVVTPRRSPGGQRLYSEADIEHLAHLHRAVLAGRSIGQVAALDRAGLAELVAEDAEREGAVAGHTPSGQAEAVAAAYREAIAATERLDSESLEGTLKRAALQFNVPVLLDHLVAPLLRELGERWENGTLQAIHEHVASVEVQRLLTWLVQSARVDGDAPLLAVTTPRGQQIELGALMVAASAAAEGWRVMWFGPNLPAADILLGVASVKPDALAISLIHQSRDAELHRELETVARGTAGKVHLLVGGRAASAHALMLARHGATTLTDLESFRQWLRGYREHAGRHQVASPGLA